jgi:hypothetical protein
LLARDKHRPTLSFRNQHLLAFHRNTPLGPKKEIKARYIIMSKTISRLS